MSPVLLTSSTSISRSRSVRARLSTADVAVRGLQYIGFPGLDPQHRSLGLQFPDAVGGGELVEVVEELLGLLSCRDGVGGLRGC